MLEEAFARKLERGSGTVVLEGMGSNAKSLKMFLVCRRVA